jgi:hypothetical protein
LIPDRALALDGWQGTSDRVMGSVSRETLAVEDRAGRPWLRLTGRVRLENQGGFIQMGADLAPDGQPVDLSAYAGVRLLVRGNGERYGCHLRTAACRRPWQSYRHPFTATPTPTSVTLPFAGFAPHRVAEPLDPCTIRRIGLVAIGRAFDADLAVAEVAFYARGCGSTQTWNSR